MLPLYDNIRRRRIELNMSQEQLAKELGYTSRTTIAKIEAGKIDIPQSKVVAFARALQISPGQLMGWTSPENQALWRNTTIENDKIVRKYPGLVDAKNAAKVAKEQENSPLPFDISPDIVHKDTSAVNGEGDKNTIKIAGRDGSLVERTLTDEQLDLIKKMIEQMPDADNL